MRIEGRPYTTIERNLVERLVTVVLADLSGAFDPLSPVTFRFERLETNPRFATIGRPANAAVLRVSGSTWRIAADGSKCCCLTRPSSQFAKSCCKDSLARNSAGTSIWEAHLVGELWNTRVPIQAVLDTVEMSLRDVLKLHIGSRISLNAELDPDIQLICGDLPMFSGKDGPQGRQYRDPDRREDRKRAGDAMMLSFWGDAVVALLLIATIGYSVLLNRRLATVRSDRDKFEALVRNLTAASQRAEAAVSSLRGTADELGRRLEKKVEEARGLADDLAYMIERGGSIADRLANQIRAGRDELKPDLRPEVKPAVRPDANREHRVEPVQRQTAPRPEPARPEPPRTVPSQAAPRVEVQPTRYEPRVVSRAAIESSLVPTQPDNANAPSRAERDLLRALARRR